MADQRGRKSSADRGRRARGTSGDTAQSGVGNVVQTAAAIAVLAVSAVSAGKTSLDDSRVTSSGPGGGAAGGTSGAAGSRATSLNGTVAVLPEPASGMVGRVDSFQRRTPRVAFLVGVVKKFGDDRGGKLAALIAYYGFFSLFPALLALVTVLGFVLEGRDDLRRDIADSALGQFPVIGESIGNAVSSPLTGSPVALVIGIVGALWAGMGAMQAAQDAMNDVWDVPRNQYPNFFVKRLRSLMLLATIGLLFIAGAVVPQIIGAVSGGAWAEILVFVAAVALDIGVFLIAYKVMTVADIAWRQLVPGAILAGTAYAILQLVGRIYITNTLSGAENTYGTFAVVIGLLSWMFLVAQVTVFSAEINVVSARHLWPRALKQDSLTPQQ